MKTEPFKANTDNKVTVFTSPTFGQIRTLTDEQNEPWFVGKDIAEKLGYSNTRDALAKHVDENDKTTVMICDTGSNYKSQTVIVNESGMYSLILQSRLPKAQDFKHWVTAEVLPSIRKDGGYVTLKQGESEDELFARALTIAEKKLTLLNDEKEEAEDKARYLKDVLLCEDCYTTTDIAKELGLSVHELYDNLLKKNILFYDNKKYNLLADYCYLQLSKMRTAYRRLEDGKVMRCPPYLVWTEKGRMFLHNVIRMNPPHLTRRIAIMCSRPTLFSY